MKISTLESALAENGIVAAVEERGRLAVIVAADEKQARSIAAKRSWIVATAAGHGFSHVALEIASGRQPVIAGRSDAALSGD